MPSPSPSGSGSGSGSGVHRVDVRPIQVAEKRTSSLSAPSVSADSEQPSPIAAQSISSPSSSPLLSASSASAPLAFVSDKSATLPVTSSQSTLHSSSSASSSSTASSLLSVQSTVAFHRSSSRRSTSSSTNTVPTAPSPPPRRAASDEATSSLSVCCGHYSMQGLRAEMEDKVVLLPHPQFNRTAELLDCVPRSYFAVFDGHGGDVSAQYCAQHVHYNFLAEPAFASAPSKALHNALLRTDNEFCAACRRINLMSSSGTTALCAFIQRHTLTVANIGDSRAVLVKRSGTVQALSSDHKPGRKDEKARIEALGGRVAVSEEDAWTERSSSQPSCTFLSSCFPSSRPLRVFPGGLSVSRTIGDIGVKGMKLVIAEAEVWEANLHAEDDLFVVMGCDGVWDVLSNQHVADLCKKWEDKRQLQQQQQQQQSSQAKGGKQPYDELAECIAKEAFKRGSSDNISVVVVKLEWSAGTLSQQEHEEKQSVEQSSNGKATNPSRRKPL